MTRPVACPRCYEGWLVVCITSDAVLVIECGVCDGSWPEVPQQLVREITGSMTSTLGTGGAPAAQLRVLTTMPGPTAAAVPRADPDEEASCGT